MRKWVKTNWYRAWCISAYEQVRTKYHAVGAFPHLFDKTKPEIDVFKVGKEYMDPLWLINSTMFLK